MLHGTPRTREHLEHRRDRTSPTATDSTVARRHSSRENCATGPIPPSRRKTGGCGARRLQPEPEPIAPASEEGERRGHSASRSGFAAVCPLDSRRRCARYSAQAQGAGKRGASAVPAGPAGLAPVGSRPGDGAVVEPPPKASSYHLGCAAARPATERVAPEPAAPSPSRAEPGAPGPTRLGGRRHRPAPPESCPRVTGRAFLEFRGHHTHFCPGTLFRPRFPDHVRRHSPGGPDQLPPIALAWHRP